MLSFRSVAGGRSWTQAAVLGLSLVASGCGTPPAENGNATAKSSAEAAHDHRHDHPSTGPHGGDIVELGNEAYHAEVVHGDGGTVTVYVLDGSAKKAVPVDAPEVVINVARDGKPEQFTLVAEPEEGEAEGQSSRYRVVDEGLAKALDGEVAARLVITISGKQYSGKIEHKHDHDHDHDHDHGHGHDHK